MRRRGGRIFRGDGRKMHMETAAIYVETSTKFAKTAAFFVETTGVGFIETAATLETNICGDGRNILRWPPIGGDYHSDCVDGHIYGAASLKTTAELRRTQELSMRP